MMDIFLGMVIGLFAGALGGMFGIGGGILIVPALVFALGFTQHKAQGTSVACLVAPVALPSVLNYHQKGMVDWKVAGLIALGFLCGGFIGSKFAVTLDPLLMKRSFAIFLVLVAGWMWFGPTKQAPAKIETQAQITSA